MVNIKAIIIGKLQKMKKINKMVNNIKPSKELWNTEMPFACSKEQQVLDKFIWGNFKCFKNNC